MKRFVAACAALLIATPLFAQFEEGFVSPMSPPPPPRKVFKPGTIVELTDVRWIEYMAKMPKSLLGTYAQCGGYLFTYTPKGKEKERLAPMVGFAYPNQAEKIGVSVLRSADRIHVQETATETHVEVMRDDEGKEYFNVFLVKDEIRKLRACGKIAIEKKK